MKVHAQLALTPAQEQAFEWLLGAIPREDVLVLRGRSGAGKTTVLERVRAEKGGTLVSLSDASHGFRASEESLLHTIERAVQEFDLIIVDDLHVIAKTAGGRNQSRMYLFDAALTAILAEASAARKKLVFGTEGEAPWPIQRRACLTEITA